MYLEPLGKAGSTSHKPRVYSAKTKGFLGSPNSRSREQPRGRGSGRWVSFFLISRAVSSEVFYCHSDAETALRFGRRGSTEKREPNLPRGVCCMAQPSSPSCRPLESGLLRRREKAEAAETGEPMIKERRVLLSRQRPTDKTFSS